jgi:hypothetical protein
MRTGNVGAAREADRGGSGRVFVLALLLVLTALGLAACYYVVPAPPPPPGAPLAVPPQVRERPQCGWTYGLGWRGWAWYSSVPC